MNNFEAIEMTTAYMYTFYSDLVAFDNEHALAQAKQHARDTVFWKSMTKNQIPNFPMKSSLFQNYREFLKNATKINEMMKILIVTKDPSEKVINCEILTNGDIVHKDTMQDALNYLKPSDTEKSAFTIKVDGSGTSFLM